MRYITHFLEVVRMEKKLLRYDGFLLKILLYITEGKFFKKYPKEQKVLK